MATQQKNLVRDFFTNRVVTINDNDNVLLAAQKMKEVGNCVGGFPALDLICISTTLACCRL